MGVAEGDHIPLNIAVLNQFMFWRGDIEITYVVSRTSFSSMRLQQVVTYGSPGLTTSSRTSGYSSNMNFSLDNYEHTEVVNFAAQQDFLRTYEGEGSVDKVQNYSIGHLGVYVLNSLNAPESVPQINTVLVFVRFLETKVAVPRAISPFTWNGYLEYEDAATVLLTGYTAGALAHLSVIPALALNYVLVDTSSFRFNGPAPPYGVYYPLTPTPVHLEVRNIVGTQSQFIDFTLVRFDHTAITSTMFFAAGETIPPSDFGASYSWSNANSSVLRFDPIPISTVPLAALEEEVVEFVAQGADDSIVEQPEENLAVSLETATPVSTLLETTKEVHNVPCVEEPNEKFGFTVSDVHEVARRYIRMVPVNNEALDQFVTITRSGGDGIEMTNVNIGVQPQHIFRGLFAAWAGSVKYRIYSDRGGSLPQVFFSPYMNPSGRRPGIPIIDAMSGHSFINPDIGLAITSTTAITGSMAREVQYPITQDVSYIDVSVPFQSHFNFCFNSKTGPVTPVSSGTLTVASADAISPNRIFTAFGDDLRLGIFRPPRVTTLNMNAFREGTGGFY